MTPEQEKQSDFLLADFNAIKAEIARRSNLQKVVLTLIVSFYAWFVPTAMTNSISLINILIIWLVVILAYTFYFREGYEISRLALIIRERIAKYMSEMLKIESDKIIPSEVHDRQYPTDGITRRYDRIFNSTVFLIIPIVCTIIYICTIIKCS